MITEMELLISIVTVIAVSRLIWRKISVHFATDSWRRVAYAPDQSTERYAEKLDRLWRNYRKNEKQS